MSGNLYYDPEKFNLTIIGELDFSDGCYCFDYTIVWQDNATKKLYMADDAGCSCPCPFEDHSLNDLVEIERPQVLIDYLNQRLKDAYGPSCNEGDIGALVMKAREVGVFEYRQAA